MLDSIVKIVRGIVRLQGGTDGTAVGNNGNKLLVDGSGVTQPVSGTVNAAQSGVWSANAVQSGSWTVSLTGGNTVAVKVDGSAVTQPISAVSLPLPAGAATAAKQPALGIAGTSSLDVISVQGIAGMTPLQVTVTNSAVTNSVKLDDGSGNAVTSQANGSARALDVGVAVAGIQVDPRSIRTLLSTTDSITIQGGNATAVKVDGSAVTQPVSGTVTSNIGTTNGLALDSSLGTLIAKFGNIGQKISSNSAPVVLASDQSAIPVTQSGIWAVTSNVGTTNGLALDATLSALSSKFTTTANGLKVDGSAVTQPISGTVIANAGSGTWNTQDAADGPVNAGTAASKSILTGAVYNASAPTLTSGQQAAVQIDSNARLVIRPLTSADFVSAVQSGAWTVAASQSGGWTVIANAGSGTFQTNITNSSLPVTQSGVWAVTANAGSGTFNTQDASAGSVVAGTAASKSMLGGGQFNTTLPTLTTGQQSAIQLDPSGRLITRILTVSDTVTIQGGNATAVKVDGSAVTQPISASSLPLPTGAATSIKQPALGTAGASSSDVLSVQGISGMTPLQVTVTNNVITNTVKLDDGNGNVVTSQVNGSGRSLDVGVNVAGVQVDPRAIRTLTSADIVSAAQSGSWTVTANAGTGTMSVSDLADGPVAAGTAASKSLLTGVQFNSILPTLANGQQSAIQADQSGRLIIRPLTATDVVSAIQAGAWSVAQSGSWTVSANAGTGTFNTQDISAGPVAPGTAASKSLLTGGVYNSGVIALATGQQSALQLTSSGALVVSVVNATSTTIVKLDDGNGNAVTSQTNGSARALDVGVNVAGVQIDPRSIRALTSADIVSAAQSGNWSVKITDGTNTQTVKPASTAAVVTDSSAVVALSPNSPLPAGTNQIGAVAFSPPVFASSTTALASGASYTSPAFDASNGQTWLSYSAYSQTPLAVVFQESSDNTNWSPTDSYIVASGTSNYSSHKMSARYGRVVVTNTGNANAGGAANLNILVSQSNVANETDVSLVDAFGNQITAFPSGRLKITSESKQVFLDTYDTGVIDITNKWNSPVSGGGGTSAAGAAGNLNLSTGITANGYSYITTQPTFRAAAPGWLEIQNGVSLPFPLPANTYMFWGLGNPQAVPVVGNVLIDAVGFEISTSGKMYAVCYAAGVRNVIQDMSAATGNNTQIIDANVHKYYIYFRGDLSYWGIDNSQNIVATMSTGTLGPVNKNLPYCMMAVAGTTAPTTSGAVISAGVWIGDSTGARGNIIADSTYPWRGASVSSTGAISVSDVVSIGGTQGAITVGTSAALACSNGTSNLANRKTLTVYNNGTATVYWGYTNTVTTSTGTPIVKGQPAGWTGLGNGVSIYLISGTAGQKMRVTESA